MRQHGRRVRLSGHGECACRRKVAQVKETSGGKGEVLTADIDPAKTRSPAAKIEAILGQGRLRQWSLLRSPSAPSSMMGEPIGNASLRVNTWAAFAAATTRPLVTATLPIVEKELQGVLKALRGAGINIVAIHNHMTAKTRGCCSCIYGESARRLIWPRA